MICRVLDKPNGPKLHVHDTPAHRADFLRHVELGWTISPGFCQLPGVDWQDGDPASAGLHIHDALVRRKEVKESMTAVEILDAAVETDRMRRDGYTPEDAGHIIAEKYRDQLLVQPEAIIKTAEVAYILAMVPEEELEQFVTILRASL